mmetsp:Transcript_97163/g.251342  ORF Transcript_97163/g.251342 Transcript_97163/m.251342 type:complete len:231 (+) Transcript_97163:103-795(+)
MAAGPVGSGSSAFSLLQSRRPVRLLVGRVGARELLLGPRSLHVAPLLDLVPLPRQAGLLRLGLGLLLLQMQQSREDVPPPGRSHQDGQEDEADELRQDDARFAQTLHEGLDPVIHVPLPGKADEEGQGLDLAEHCLLDRALLHAGQALQEEDQAQAEDRGRHSIIGHPPHALVLREDQCRAPVQQVRHAPCRGHGHHEAHLHLHAAQLLLNSGPPLEAPHGARQPEHDVE